MEGGDATGRVAPFRYLRFGDWDKELAAADFSALVLEGFARTLPALDAAALPVCLVFFFGIAGHLLPASVLQQVGRWLKLRGAIR